MEWILLWIWFNNKTMIAPSLWDYGALFPWNPTKTKRQRKELWSSAEKEVLNRDGKGNPWTFGKYFFIDSLDTVKTLLFTGQEALLMTWPSQHFTDFTVDESTRSSHFSTSIPKEQSNVDMRMVIYGNPEAPTVWSSNTLVRFSRRNPVPSDPTKRVARMRWGVLFRGRHPVGEWIFIKNDEKTL